MRVQRVDESGSVIGIHRKDSTMPRQLRIDVPGIAQHPDCQGRLTAPISGDPDFPCCLGSEPDPVLTVLGR